MAKEKKNPYVMTIGFRKNTPEHIQVAELLNSLGREKAQYIVKAIRAYQFMDARTEKQQDSDRVVYEYQTIKQIVLQIMSEHENVGGIPVDMPEYQTSCIEDNMNAESNISDAGRNTLLFANAMSFAFIPI